MLNVHSGSLCVCGRLLNILPGNLETRLRLFFFLTNTLPITFVLSIKHSSAVDLKSVKSFFLFAAVVNLDLHYFSIVI